MRGEHDLATAPELTRALEQARAHSDVLVDLSECDFIDSTVISIFIRTALEVQAHGERLVVVIPGESGQIARAVHMTRLSEFLPVHSSRGDAIASLERRPPSVSPDPKT
jgi:anti-anti-sigma factor